MESLSSQVQAAAAAAAAAVFKYKHFHWSLAVKEKADITTCYLPQRTEGFTISVSRVVAPLATPPVTNPTRTLWRWCRYRRRRRRGERTRRKRTRRILVMFSRVHHWTTLVSALLLLTKVVVSSVSSSYIHWYLRRNQVMTLRVISSGTSSSWILLASRDALML